MSIEPLVWVVPPWSKPINPVKLSPDELLNVFIQSAEQHGWDGVVMIELVPLIQQLTMFVLELEGGLRLLHYEVLGELLRFDVLRVEKVLVHMD